MNGFLRGIAVLGLAAAACDESVVGLPPPLDSFYFPTGLAVRRLPGTSERSALLVVSSNFDLRYDPTTGGTMLAVDPDAEPNSLPDCTGDKCGDTLKPLGSARMGSFGGEVSFADPNLAHAPAGQPDVPGACPEIAAMGGGSLTRVLAASRSENAVYWMTMNDAGALDCGARCKVSLNPAGYSIGDAYGVTSACRTFADGPMALAFVTHLRGQPGADGQEEGFVSAVPLVSALSALNNNSAAPPGAGEVLLYNLGPSPTGGGAFDPASGLVMFTTRFSLVGSAPLRWLDLSTIRQFPTLLPGSTNLFTQVRGAMPRGIALSNDGTRAYVVLQIYDVDEANRSGSLIVVGAELAVLDIRPDAGGAPRMEVLNLVPIDAGPTVVKVLPARGAGVTGVRDLVAVTCTDGGSLVLYDDQMGNIAAVLSVDSSTGLPKLGKQPFGLAVEQVGPGRAAVDGPCKGAATCDRLYVGSFDTDTVSFVELDPARPEQLAIVKRIGRER